MSKHILLLPGLGDHHPKLLLSIIKHWPLFGVTIHFMPINWRDDEPWEGKLQRICLRIDELYERYGPIGLIGISAGGSAAINAYSQKRQRVHRVVFICGKLLSTSGVNPIYYQKNPAFRDSLADAQPLINKLSARDKSKMLNVRPLYDNIVAVKYTKIPGVRQLVMLSAGHITSIGLALTLYSPPIARFFRKK